MIATAPSRFADLFARFTRENHKSAPLKDLAVSSLGQRRVFDTGMASDETAIEVSDFEFHALRKVRLSREPLTGDNSRRLAISSSYGIGITISAANQLLSFSTSDIHQQKADRTNINEEVTSVRTRTTNYFDEKASLVAVACNCDGSLVGVLADTDAGPMVHIFDAAAFSLEYNGHISPISAVRISAEANAAARCFEWSPAAADTLVAAASDKSLVTVAVKTESSSYTMVGERKMGAAVRAISWSRKGKQLVVGDDLGKVVQMKPELDIVRSTMPPDACTIANPAVVGLFWMATTEFLVVYGLPTSKDVQATIMITKKDKPIVWKDLPDLSYGSPNSALSPSLNALCLLDWNAIVTTSTKSSEVTVVGKAAESWQVWVPDELHQASLPTNSATAETFAIGADLDLSANQQLVLSDDGQKCAPASPIMCILTTDGVLMSYHAVNLKQGAVSMQVARKPVNVSAIRVGAKPAGAGGQTATATSAAPAASPATPATPATPAPVAQKPLFGVAAPAAAAATTTPTAAAPATSQLLAQLAQAPICSPNVKPAGTPAAAGSLFGTAPAAAPLPPAAPAAVATPPDATAANAAKQRKLVEDRGKVNTLLQEVQNEATALTDEIARMKEITSTTRPTIGEMERQLKVEETKKLHGIDGYVNELEEEERRNERILKTATIRISDRLRMVEEAGEGAGALAIMRKDYDYDREESMSQLQRRVTSVRTSMAEVQKELARMRAPQSPQVYESDTKWTSDRVERVNGTIKNIQKIVKLERDKIEDVEALVRNVVQLKLSDDEVRKRNEALERDEKHEEEVKVVTVKKKPLPSSSRGKQMTPTEVAEAKKRLINAKTLFPHPAPRRFVPEFQTQKKQSQTTATLNESVMLKSALNQSLSSSYHHPTVVVNSPLREQLEQRLLEVTKPRKAIQLPSLEKFAIKQESRPAQLREPPPSPIVAAAGAGAAKPAVVQTTSSLFGGGAAAATKAAPAFRLGEPQASSTPAKPAAAAPAAPASSAASLFGKPTTAPTSLFGPPAVAAKEKEPEKTEETKKEEEVKQKEEKTAADAAAAKPATTSIFGGASSTASAAAPSITGQPATTTTADATVPVNGAAAAVATTTAPAAEQEKPKVEDKKEEATKPVFAFGDSKPATAADSAAAKPATSSIFGGGTTTEVAKPAATSSIFGGGTTTEVAKPATTSIFGGASATTTTTPPKSIFGAPTTPVTSPFGAAAAAAATVGGQPKSIFGGAVSAALAAPSPFGATATPPTTTTSSIFGGGVAQQQQPQQQQASSPFGSSFGKPATSGASGFSFKSAAAAAASDTQQQPSSGFGQSSSVFGGQQPSSGFGTAPAPASSSSFGSVFGANKPAAAGSFAAAAAAAAADEGMDDGGSGASGAFGGGGGGFMGGLGSSTSANAGRNVFGGGGGGFGSGAATNTQAASIFGKSTTSSFGAKPSSFGATTTTTAFGGGASAFGAAASPQQSSFGAATSSPSSGFGKPAFGSGPSFGAKSIFGGAATASPQQQQQAASTNAFGAGASGGGFAAFANQGGGFGSVAAQQQQQGGGTSIFGGAVNKPPASSIFGGSTAGTTNKFSSWR